MGDAAAGVVHPGDRGLSSMVLPSYVAVHVACLGAIWTGVTLSALGLCVASYSFQMMALSAGYHRYFAHRSSKTSRPILL